jgi:coproporphyrinogen III oxidase
MVEGIFTDFFQTLNTNQFGEAMEIVLSGFLDQRPKIVRWSLGTAFTRIKKRFARS